MRRAEAEQEAAWRNAQDERRSRLEFYAFDASAGLAEDAWEVTMRLRREPSQAAPATAAPAPAVEPVAADPWAGQATAPWDAVEAAPDQGDPSAAVASDDLWPGAPREAAEVAEAVPVQGRPRAPSRSRRRRRDRERPSTQPRREAREDQAQDDQPVPERRGRRLRRRRAQAGEAPPERGRLERLTRLVGGAVIGMAVLWVGMVITLAVLIRSTSVTGLAIFAGSMFLGMLAVALGLVIRRT